MTNKKLFDRKRFQWLEQEKDKFLKTLTIEKSVEIFESLTDPKIFSQYKVNYKSYPDNPVSLKKCLKRIKSGIIR
ncbi:MAG: hypothetical protein AB1765_13245 [Candidatus Hydrogenedentota bacterium]